MKQTFFLGLVLCAAFASCSKQPVPAPVTATDAATTIKLEQLAEMPLDERILAFNLLTPEEKYLAWYNKTEKLSRQTHKYSPEQIALIVEMKDNMKLSFYKSGTDDQREINKSTFVEPWLKRAEKLFNKEELYDVAFTLGTLRHDFAPNISNSNEGANAKENASCKCKVGSIFTCASWSYSYNSIDITYGDCSAGAECMITFGCGFAGIFNCNGSC